MNPDDANPETLVEAKPGDSPAVNRAPVTLPAAAVPLAPPAEKQRYLPLDAYRGLIMLLLVSDGFGFSRLPER